MEEINYNYFFCLAKFSIQTTILHSMFIFLDFLQLFAYFFELPIKFLNFRSHINEINNNPYLSNIKYISIYSFFRHLLVEKSENMFVYPIIVIYIVTGVFALFLFYFMLITFVKPICSNILISNFFKRITVNFFDLLFFRVLALCIFDPYFNYITNSESYIQILPIMVIGFLFLTFFHYFSSFRLCVKFDINYKHHINNFYGKDVDYFLLFMKVLISIEVNYTQANGNFVDDLCLFFILINLLILLYLIYRFFISNMINITDCFKGIGLIMLLATFLLGVIFSNIHSSAFIFGFFIFLIVFVPSLIIAIIRNKKINNISRSKGNHRLKFILLFEYYQTKRFPVIIGQIFLHDQKYLFSMENEEQIFIKYLIHIRNELKEEFNKLNDTDTLFYYILCKIYLSIINKEYNTFNLIFKVRKAKYKMKATSPLYYLNIKFFYNLLQFDIRKKGNVDWYQLNYSYHQLYGQISKCISTFENFIEKESSNTPKDYFDFSSYFNSFDKNMKEHYLILDREKSEEYQKTMFRIMIETIRNKSIKLQENSSDLFIHDEIFNQEDMLEKDYSTEHLIKLKIKLDKMSCKIIKIGNNLNHFNKKDFFILFPPKYRPIATNIFYENISKKKMLKETKEVNVENFQKFQFFIKDQDNNNKEFMLLYKLYPDINSDILYLDGKYNLSSEGFLVTETMFNTEKIVLISKNLSNLLCFEQSYLTLLSKYQYTLTFDMFIENINTHFMINKLINALIKQIKEISNISSVEDYKTFQKMDYKLSGKKSCNNYLIKFELKYSIKQQENMESYNIYHIIKQNPVTGQEKCVNNLDSTILDISPMNGNKAKIESEELHQLSSLLINNFDNRSVSSSASKMSSNLNSKSLSYKKKHSKKSINSSNNIVLVFSTLIIILSIVMLIFENTYNQMLLLNVEMLQIIIQLNRVMINSVISFYSLLCYDVPSKSQKGICENRYMKYLRQFDLEPLHEFAKKELTVKLETVHTRWDSYKRKSTELNNEIMQSAIYKKSKTSHLKYINGSFIDNPTETTFEEALTVYINKMTMISLLKEFDKIDVYPLYVNQYFVPLYFENRKINLKEHQLEIYETLFSFFDYVVELFIIQDIIIDETNSRITGNINSIIIFISVLIFLNGLMAFIFLFIFSRTKKTVVNMLIKMDEQFQNEAHLKKLRIKIEILKDMIKLYKVNPIILVNKIKDTYKRDTIQPKKTREDNYSTKKYNLSFLIKYYRIKLIIVELFYLSYCSIFIFIFIIDFNKISKCIQIMESSGLVEQLTYLNVASMQMMEFSNITENSLYNRLYRTEGEQGRFFEVMVNMFEYDKQKEIIEKQQLYSIYNQSEMNFNYDCDELFTNVNDSRFNHIIKLNPDKKYEKYLIEFCSHVHILQFNDEKALLNEIIYDNIKLVGMPTESYTEINSQKDVNHLYYLISEVLFIYRPLRAYISNFYYISIPNDVLQQHFILLLIFLIGNILIQFVDFFIFKILIIEMIEKDIQNLRDVELALSS